MAKITSAEHETISARCVEALNGHYDDHVWKAMHHHDGEGLLARQAEARAKAEAEAAARKKRRRNVDVLGINAALTRLQARA